MDLFYQRKILACHKYFEYNRPRYEIYLPENQNSSFNLTWEHKWARGWNKPRRRRQSSLDVNIQSPSIPVQHGLAKI